MFSRNIGKKGILLVNYFIMIALKFETQSFACAEFHVIRGGLHIENSDFFDSIKWWSEQIEVQGVTNR